MSVSPVVITGREDEYTRPDPAAHGTGPVVLRAALAAGATTQNRDAFKSQVHAANAPREEE